VVPFKVRRRAPLDPGHKRLPAGALGKGGGLDGPRPLEALEGRFFVRFHPGTARRKPLEKNPVRVHGEAHGGGEGEVYGRTRLYQVLRASARLPSGYQRTSGLGRRAPPPPGASTLLRLPQGHILPARAAWPSPAGRAHPATRANYPPKGPGRVLPEKKFGGGKCGKEKWRAGRCWQSSATIRPRATQGASSCPNDLELPPAASGASRSDGRAAPAGLEPTHNTPSLEFAARSDGGCISAIPYRESPPPQGLEGHQRMGTT